jgi:hypothetical protein
VDGTRCEFSAKRKCDPRLWNQQSGRQTGKSEGTLAFNSYLDTLQFKVFEAKRKLLELDRAVTAENIKNMLFHRDRSRP